MKHFIISGLLLTICACGNGVHKYTNKDRKIAYDKMVNAKKNKIKSNRDVLDSHKYGNQQTKKRNKSNQNTYTPKQNKTSYYKDDEEKDITKRNIMVKKTQKTKQSSSDNIKYNRNEHSILSFRPYIGAEYVYSTVKISATKNYIGTDDAVVGNKKNKDTSTNSGIAGFAGLKINFAKYLFVSPEIFYTSFFRNSKSTFESYAISSSMVFNNEYGIRANAGFDITKNLSIFGIGGYGYTSFEFNDLSNNTAINPKNYKIASFLYGGGASISVGKNFGISLKYIIKPMDFNYNIASPTNTALTDSYKYNVSTKNLIFSLHYAF